METNSLYSMLFKKHKSKAVWSKAFIQASPKLMQIVSFMSWMVFVVELDLCRDQGVVYLSKPEQEYAYWLLWYSGVLADLAVAGITSTKWTCY